MKRRIYVIDAPSNLELKLPSEDRGPGARGAGTYELSTPGKLEGLFEKAGLNVIETGEVDCPFNYPDFETYWQAQFSGGPIQSALRVVSEEQLGTAACDAANAFRLDNGAIHIQPNIFIFLVAILRSKHLN